MVPRSCGICIHFFESTTDFGVGECRRTAPSLSLGRTHNQIGQAKVRAQWPMVDNCEFCGEWRPALTAPQDLVDWWLASKELLI